jgi:hypothetical protein
VFAFLVPGRNIERLAFMPYNNKAEQEQNYFVLFDIVLCKNLSLNEES